LADPLLLCYYRYENEFNNVQDVFELQVRAGSRKASSATLVSASIWLRHQLTDHGAFTTAEPE